jgi:SAM-dependent methyltransferase
MPGSWRRAAAAASLLIVSASTAYAQPRTREDCEKAYPASLGRAGKDVPWVVTFDAVTTAMLSMADVTPKDLVLDLGAGDGRIAIAAAKAPFGARAVGIEYDAELARRAACLVQVEGLGDKVHIVQGDIFKEDFGAATVVTMYLLPQLNRCVRHRILALEPGTRVVSHQYAMADWEPEKSVQVQSRTVHRWTVPARVDGVWDFKDSEGTPFTVELRQAFGAVSGEVTRGGIPEAPVSGTVHGRDLRFTFESSGGKVQASGTVRGGEITGAMLAGTAARNIVGRLRGAPVAAAWTKMPPDCRSYYER